MRFIIFFFLKKQYSSIGRNIFLPIYYFLKLQVIIKKKTENLCRWRINWVLVSIQLEDDLLSVSIFHAKRI